MADTKISQLAVADSLDDAVKIPILESDLTNKSTTTNTFWNYIRNKSDAVYQPLDGDLSAIAALTTTGLIEKTGANTASIVTITSAGKNLLGDVSPNEQRTTLGLGSASTMTGPSGSIVGTTDNQILTNKTISADNNTLSGIAASSFVLSNASGNIDGSAAQKVIPAGSVVGTTDTQTLDNKSLSSLNGGPLAGFRNRIINGNFDIWQRGNAITCPANNVTYTADRWAVWCTGANMLPYRSIGLSGTGSTHSLKVDGVAGNTAFLLLQRIESASMQVTAGTYLTLSFKLLSADSRNINIQIQSANAVDNFYQSTAVTSFTKAVVSGVNILTATFTTTDACRNGIEIGISYNAVTSGTFGIGQVQLEFGSVATPFEHRPYGVELALCQRYFWTWIASSAYGCLGVGECGENNISIMINYPTTMRTVAESASILNMAVVRAGILTALSDNFTFDNPTLNSIRLYISDTNVTPGQAARLIANNNSAAFFKVNAEL